MRRDAKVFLGGVFCLVLTMMLSPPAGASQVSAKGNLVGFVFGEDGSTPVPGVVIMVKNVTTGGVEESSVSDSLGIFTVEGLDAGLYALGVTSKGGRYNSQDFFGITAGETAKISIALSPYDSETAAEAAASVVQEQKDKGEAFIGRVARYLPKNKDMEVEVEIGLLQYTDELHIKGDVTDFYMEVKNLRSEGLKTKRVLSGQTALLDAAKACAPGDFVYVICKRGIPPFFLAPLGVAAIVAGSVPLSAIYKEEPVSRYTPKK